jgi:hypothetical protein
MLTPEADKFLYIHHSSKRVGLGGTPTKIDHKHSEMGIVKLIRLSDMTEYRDGEWLPIIVSGYINEEGNCYHYAEKERPSC